nr:KedN5 family methylcobalamin-dependent radical SAM C-methyltransferase [Kibdelosporangium sp. MJ126-NF4]CEL17398.1 Radical SAM domain protein [Kibdelosporangium sp. MJ126-NF4]CTQ91374.1 Radical SAM domain protein [Kibdelosporangium sp. MJ126-NF4]
MGSERISVNLVQQGVWDMPLESMPLASGYLKASLLGDERLVGEIDVSIHNYNGGVTLMRMANSLFASGAPDILAFSVLGWNFREFGALAETFKQINPDGWVVFGGVHVANQAERTFRLHPDVDVVVNGEGEMVIRDLVHAYLTGRSARDLGDIAGISYRNRDAVLVETPPRDRIDDLDIIPSPFLTGAIPLTDDAGRFRYDVALMETNRGCPYKCSFCYWGGAVGQRVQSFSRERLRAELELFAQHKVHTIVLCDANFGMLRSDAEFVDDMIELRAKYGYPRAVETSWAKNKSKVFYEIVRKMKKYDLRSSFTLALQTLDDNALELMNRKNMKVNAWEELAAWLNQEGLDCYAELIWGAPGETVQSFMDGYDRLSRHVSRIAVYPLHLLPNTDYSEKKSEYGIMSVRGNVDDFEYILSNNTMSFADNRLMKRFLFWTRVMAENAVLRHTWIGVRELSTTSQSQVLMNLDEWIQSTDDEAAEPLRICVAEAENSDTAYGDAIKYLYGEDSARKLLTRWWKESVRPQLTAENREVLDEIFAYDLLTQPYYVSPGRVAEGEVLETETLFGDVYYVRAGVELRYDVPNILEKLREGTVRGEDIRPGDHTVDIYYRTGAEYFIGSTNHEEIVHFVGQTEHEVARAAEIRATRPDEDEQAVGGVEGLALKLSEGGAYS